VSVKNVVITKKLCIVTLCEICLGIYVFGVCDVFGQAAVSECLWPGSLGELRFSEHSVGDHGN